MESYFSSKDMRRAKSFILEEIYNSAYSRVQKNKAKSEERQAEAERLKKYKEEQAQKAEQQRKEKLLSMKLK